MRDSEPRVTLVSAGQLSTCPRMLKVADALHEEGYRVRAVTHRRAQWAVTSDSELVNARPWLSSTTVDTRREAGKTAFLPAAARYHAARRLVRALGITRSGAKLRTNAWLRSAPELVHAACAEPTDFYYFCGSSFPLAPFVSAPYAIDFEDYHSGQSGDSSEGRWQSELTASLERDVIHGARFITMGSPLIAERYHEALGVDGIVIHNVLPLPLREPSFEIRRGPLKLYWFSQTIGPGRGLEESIRDAGASGIAAEIHLRGSTGEYQRELARLAREQAPKFSLQFHEPRSPSEMVDCCRSFDVGLAVERGDTENARAALSNKIFTYIAAGLAIAFSDTPAQRAFRNALGHEQPLGALADALKKWDHDREALLNARRDAWKWAKRRWHWEHAEERGALVRAFDKHLSRAARCA